MTTEVMRLRKRIKKHSIYGQKEKHILFIIWSILKRSINLSFLLFYSSFWNANSVSVSTVRTQEGKKAIFHAKKINLTGATIINTIMPFSQKVSP